MWIRVDADGALAKALPSFGYYNYCCEQCLNNMIDEVWLTPESAVVPPSSGGASSSSSMALSAVEEKARAIGEGLPVRQKAEMAMKTLRQNFPSEEARREADTSDSGQRETRTSKIERARAPEAEPLSVVDVVACETRAEGRG